MSFKIGPLCFVHVLVVLCVLSLSISKSNISQLGYKPKEIRASEDVQIKSLYIENHPEALNDKEKKSIVEELGASENVQITSFDNENYHEASHDENEVSSEIIPSNGDLMRKKGKIGVSPKHPPIGNENQIKSSESEEEAVESKSQNYVTKKMGKLSILTEVIPFTSLKISGPVFVLSLPKGGTTTIHNYFQCGLGKDVSAHKRILETSQQFTKIGIVMRDNAELGEPLVKGLDVKGYNIFSNYEVLNWGKRCFFPTDGLENISKFYPNATILYVKREAESWYKSASMWGDLIKRIGPQKCSDKKRQFFPKNYQTPRRKERETVQHKKVWLKFYEDYSNRIRSFAKQHPSLTYIDISLEGQNTGALLEEQIGIPQICWGHSNMKTSS
mmetsp:Transcript_11659/g.25598  ORF Transcript_11659/g.25598 Transcript_11659/m.25598 type:complete len:387 (-) Transcript_11659:138-1298(-)